MSISNGVAANATNFNNAFMSRTAGTSTTGTVALSNVTDVNSGALITNTQRLINEVRDTVGVTGEGDANRKVYSNTNVVANGDDRKVAVGKLDAKFSSSGGHAHDGTTGAGATIASKYLSGVPLKGYVNRGTNLTGVTGTSTIVTTEMSGKVNSTASTVLGVVVTAPQNKIILKKTVGSPPDDDFISAAGDIVFGRLTYAATVWTLSYYTDIAGTETAYSFSGSNNVTWWYQELYNPLNSDAPPPVYNEIFTIPTDNATESVRDASTSQSGKVVLSGSAGADVAASGSAGTSNGTVANADHAHRGVASFAKTAGTLRYGAISLTEGANTSITDNADGSFTIASTATASPLTTKGDVYTYSTVNARLPVGTNGQVLSANSSQTTGLEWITNVVTESVVSKTANYTATTSDTVILCDSSGGSFTITLYAASGNSGKKITIKKTEGSDFPVIIDGNAAELVDTKASMSLYEINDFITLVCDGTGWKAISKAITIGVRYTGTASTTPTSLTETVIKYSTKVYDPGSTALYDTSSGLFTVPVGGFGKYRIRGFANIAATAGAASNAFEMHVYVAGASRAKRYQTAFVTSSVEHAPFIEADYQCADGDVIGVYIGQNLTGTNLTISNDVHTFIDIMRIGN